jgi:hypothetical protein
VEAPAAYAAAVVDPPSGRPHRGGRRAPRRASLIVLVAGLVLVGLYALLRMTGVGKIGQPTDIGGGGILLAGYAMTLLGAGLVLADVLYNRRNNRPK